MYDILKALNSARRKAVTTSEGFVLLIADAGSNSPRALSNHSANLFNI